LLAGGVQFFSAAPALVAPKTTAEESATANAVLTNDVMVSVILSVRS
jgi:hypothetical protein